METSPVGPTPPTPPPSAAARVAVVVLATGVLAALFLADWRLLVAGVVVAFAVAFVGAR